MIRKQNEEIVRIGFDGLNKVGKTALISTEIKGQFNQTEFNKIYHDFRIKRYKVGQKTIQGVIGRPSQRGEMYQSRRMSYFNQVDCIGVCFDLNNIDSLYSYDFDRFKGLKNPHKPIWLIGCKADLQHEIYQSQIQNISSRHNLRYVETSSKLNKGVKDLFEEMIKLTFQYKQKEKNQMATEKSLKNQSKTAPQPETKGKKCQIM